MENLTEFCAPGATAHEERISVSPGVSLRLVTFSPAKSTSNPPVVFVPGWISRMESWKHVLPEMTRDFPVFYIETREKISSRIDGKVEYSVEAIAREIAAFVSQSSVKSGQYILFGSSLGATVILDSSRFLVKDPKCLVLVGPNAVFRVPRFGIVVIHLFYPGFYIILKPFIKWYLKTFRLDIKSDYAQYAKYCRALDAADPWKLKKAALAFSQYEVWNLLESIEYPSLIVGASKDSLHEPENLKKMVNMMPRATYLDMETNKSTHSKTLVEEIRNYLQRLKSSLHSE